MNIQQAIHSIVEGRENLKSSFLELKSTVDEAQAFCNEVNKWLVNPDWQYYLQSLHENDNLKVTIPAIRTDLDSLQERISKLVSTDSHKVGDLERVVNRITRGEFNFCFMGAWRQGKSFVLDKLLEMGEYIMPTSNHGATTGTVVSVRNNENPKYSDAKISYYTVEDLVGKIKGYIEYFDLGIDFKVDTSSPNLDVIRENFAHACHSISYTQPNFDGNTHKQQMFETFESLLHQVDQYKKFLGVVDEEPLVLMENGQTKEGHLRELRKKICFFDINMTPCYEVLAVKKVEVSKYFKIGDEEVGPVMFTDTCGIGEYRLGIDEELQKVLLCDSDIAVAVAKVPDDDTTIDKLATFHDTISPVLSQQEPGKWVYYLINKKDNIKMDRSEEFKVKIEKSLSKIGLYLPSSNYQIVQAAHQNEIYNFILQTILQPVADNIESVDNVLFNRTKEEANRTIALYKKLKTALKDLSVPTFDTDKEKEKKIVNEVFNDIREGLQDLTNTISDPSKFEDKELELLTEEIDSIKDAPNGFDLVQLFFPQEIEALIQKEKITEQDIVKFINDKKSEIVLKLSLKINAQRNFTGDEFSILSRYRQQLIRSFQARLDAINTDHVDSSLNKIKSSVGNVFVEKGKLSLNILNAPKDSSFYNAIIAYAKKEGLPKLAEFFTEKRDAQLTYMNSILDEVINKILLQAKFTVSMNYINDGKMMAEQFYNVLLTIESNIKKDLRTYFAREMLVETIIQHYHNMVGEIEGQLLTPYVGDKQYNELYQEFIRVYVKLYYELFRSEDLVRKENGVKAWREMRKNVYQES